MGRGGGDPMPEVMVVEDDFELQELYETSLSVAGYHICAKAFDGQGALDALRREGAHPDVIIMDHRMPVMSGLDAAREILSLDPSARIIMVSADSSVSDAALAAGASAFLPKPFPLGELLKLLERLCAAAAGMRPGLPTGGAGAH